MLLTFVLVVVGLLPPITAFSQEAELSIELPDRLAALLDDAPKGLDDRALELITGFGSEGGIDADGLALSISVDRAQARAGALRRFFALDLDGNLSVTREELNLATSVLSARSRGRLMAQVERADQDADGALSLEEIQQAGTVAGLRAVSDDEAAERMSLILMDMDSDGFVTLGEVRETLRDAEARAKAKGQGDQPSFALPRDDI